MEKQTVIVVDGAGPEYATLAKALSEKGMDVVAMDGTRSIEMGAPISTEITRHRVEAQMSAMREEVTTRKQGKVTHTTRVGKYTTNPHAKNPLKELKRMVSPRQLKKAEKKMARAEREVLARAAQNPGSDA